MARYIVDLNEEFGMTVVMIEHDMGVVMDISHRVMVLDFGRKIAEGDPAAVLADRPCQARLSRRGRRSAGRSRRRADRRGVRGMMDYAGRVAAGRHLPEAAAPQRPRARRRDRAAREGSRPLAQPSPGATTRRACAISRSALRSLGLGRGDVVGLIGDNRPDWVVGEIAAHAIGAMSLGLYRDALDEEVGLSARATARPSSSSPRTRSRSTSCCARRPHAAPCSTSSIPTRAACANTPTRA